MTDLATTIRELGTSHAKAMHQVDVLTKERDALAESHAELYAALNVLLAATVAAQDMGTINAHRAAFPAMDKARALVPK